MPDVSIIIPVYNTNERMIKRCFDSLVNQTFRQIEIIIVDDGSFEKTSRFCDELILTDSRAQVVHQENAGLSAARNTGFKKSSGKWVMFVDSDDWIEADCIQSMLNAGVNANAQVVLSSWYKDFRSGSQIRGRLNDRTCCYDEIACIRLQEGLFDWSNNYSDVWAKLFDSGYLRKNELHHNETILVGSESLEFNLRVFENLRAAAYVDQPFYHYSYNPGSVSTVYSERYLDGLVASYSEIGKWISSASNREALDIAFERHLPNVVATSAISGVFNPTNTAMPYKSKCKKCYEMANALKKAAGCKKFDYSETTLSRRITCRCIFAGFFPVVALLARIRHVQKNLKCPVRNERNAKGD